MNANALQTPQATFVKSTSALRFNVTTALNSTPKINATVHVILAFLGFIVKSRIVQTQCAPIMEHVNLILPMNQHAFAPGVGRENFVKYSTLVQIRDV